MTAKVRCTQCHGFFDREEFFYTRQLTRICSEGCWNDWKYAQDVKRRTRHRGNGSTTKAPIELRFSIKDRDENLCRWCGSNQGTQVHHIKYRSEGGPNTPENLIALCFGCHARAHSSKRAFQPLLLGYIWLLYVHGRQVFIPDVARFLDAQGLLTVLQQERLAS